MDIDIFHTCSPLPWEVSKDTDIELEIIDAEGNVVLYLDWRTFQDDGLFKDFTEEQVNAFKNKFSANVSLIVLSSSYWYKRSKGLISH